MGIGHVMRCLSLAQAWQDMGGAVTLLSRELPVPLQQRAQAGGVNVKLMDPSSDDLAETISLLQLADWGVLDGYQFGHDFCAHLSRQSIPILMLDDYGQMDSYPCHAILNQNITAAESLYSRRSEECLLFLGCRYALLRREFRSALAPRDLLTCERVLVTFGGGDAHNVTFRAVMALKQIPHLHAKVVIGAANPHRESLERMIAGEEERIELVSNTENMSDLMDWAQLAISAGGTSILELASRGVPTLLVITADNQDAICRMMHQEGVMRLLGVHSHMSAEGFVAAMLEATSEASRAWRAEVSEKGRQQVDGHGALRVCREMMIRNIGGRVVMRPAAPEDARRIFDWANDPITRSVSFQQDPIPWETHLAWFEKKLHQPTCSIFIAEDAEGIPFGMVRFDSAEHVATLSVNLAPSHRSRGLGADVLMVACREFMTHHDAREVWAFIKPSNKASLRTFQKAGFVTGFDQLAAGQQAVCMVLR